MKKVSGSDSKSRPKSSGSAEESDDVSGGDNAEGGEERDDQKDGENSVNQKPISNTSKIIKKCKSATFQIDGHTYTIGECNFS